MVELRNVRGNTTSRQGNATNNLRQAARQRKASRQNLRAPRRLGRCARQAEASRANTGEHSMGPEARYGSAYVWHSWLGSGIIWAGD